MAARKTTVENLMMSDRGKTVIVQGPDWSMHGRLEDLSFETARIPVGSNRGTEEYVPGHTTCSITVSGWTTDRISPTTEVTVTDR